MTSYEDAITAIATAIEARKTQFPQLADFSVDEHCNLADMMTAQGVVDGVPASP